MDTKAITFRTTPGGYTHCRVCNRPLSDHVSMSYGMGPICRQNSGPPIEDLFSIRSDYEVEIEGDIVLLVDLDLGGRSITNDAARVIDDLVRRGILKADAPLIYRDSNGEWSELLHRDGRFKSFAPIATHHVTDRDEALALMRRRNGA